MAKTYHGAYALFETPAALFHAAQEVTKAGFTRTDAHTPFPVHGLDHALRQGPSHVGWIAAGCGLLGIVLGQLMMWWMNGYDYPLWVAGKPPYSWQSTIPINFETMILLTAFGAVFGMLALNKLPRLYSPFFKYSQAERATDDGFVLVIEARDPKFDQQKTLELLKRLGGKHVELVEE
jgi:hypothetical protein